jgi:hypothetical protein
MAPSGDARKPDPGNSQAEEASAENAAENAPPSQATVVALDSFRKK